MEIHALQIVPGIYVESRKMFRQALYQESQDSCGLNLKLTWAPACLCEDIPEGMA